jgi:hypothetical protein
MALSSRGLGRRPLTAVTRVRIPLGLPIALEESAVSTTLSSILASIGWSVQRSGGSVSTKSSSNTISKCCGALWRYVHARLLRVARYPPGVDCMARECHPGGSGDVIPSLAPVQAGAAQEPARARRRAKSPGVKDLHSFARQRSSAVSQRNRVRLMYRKAQRLISRRGHRSRREDSVASRRSYANGAVS